MAYRNSLHADAWKAPEPVVVEVHGNRTNGNSHAAGVAVTEGIIEKEEPRTAGRWAC